jgi:hypothetical protein
VFVLVIISVGVIVPPAATTGAPVMAGVALEVLPVDGGATAGIGAGTVVAGTVVAPVL